MATDPNPLSDDFLHALTRVARPIAEARGLPSEAYTSAAFARHERDHVLARTL